MSANAGQQHVDVNGFSDVIVRAFTQSVDNILGLILCRHHDHGKLSTGLKLTELPEDVEAVDSRHHDVEQHKVVLLLCDSLQHRATISDDLNRIATTLEPAGEHVAIH